MSNLGRCGGISQVLSCPSWRNSRNPTRCRLALGLAVKVRMGLPRCRMLHRGLGCATCAELPWSDEWPPHDRSRGTLGMPQGAQQFRHSPAVAYHARGQPDRSVQRAQDMPREVQRSHRACSAPGRRAQVTARTARESFSVISATWSSSRMKGGASRTWSPFRPSRVPDIG